LGNNNLLLSRNS